MIRDTLLVLDANFKTARWLGQLFSKVETYQRLSQVKPGCVLAFEGGNDIHPSFYNQKAGFHTQTANFKRDSIEYEAFKKAVKVKAGIVGICRGAQLACALSGGSLIQHVTGHHGDHWIATEDKQHNFIVTSSHHQMMYPFDLKDEEYSLLAWSSNSQAGNVPRSDVYLGEDDMIVQIPDKEPEVVWFPKTRSIAIQGHPEWATHNGVYQRYCRDLVTKYLLTKGV